MKNNIKRVLTLLLVFVLFVGMIPSASAAYETSDENLSYKEIANVSRWYPKGSSTSYVYYYVYQYAGGAIWRIADQGYLAEAVYFTTTGQKGKAPSFEGASFIFRSARRSL